MTKAEAKALIIEVLGGIAPEAEFDKLPGNVQLRDELDLDSMDFLDFVAAVHERTGIEIPEAEYGRLATLDDAVAYLVH